MKILIEGTVHSHLEKTSKDGVYWTRCLMRYWIAGWPPARRTTSMRMAIEVGDDDVDCIRCLGAEP